MSRHRRRTVPSHSQLSWALLKARNGYTLTKEERAMLNRTGSDEGKPAASPTEAAA